MDTDKALTPAQHAAGLPACTAPLQLCAPVRLKTLQEAQVCAKEWDRLAADLSGNFLHGYGWSRFMAGKKASPRYVVLEVAGRPAAAAWYLVTGRKTGPLKLMQMHLEALPCFDPRVISAADVFRELQAQAKQEDCIALSFGNSSRDHLPAGIPCRLREKINFAVDLRPTPAALLANLHHKHRSHIRKAARAGIRVAVQDSGDALSLADSLDDMFRHSLSRHLSAGKERDAREETPMRDLIRELVATGHVMLFVAFRDGVPLSCYAAAIFNNEAYLLYGVSSSKGYELNASFLAVWSMIEHFKERGYRTMNLGSVVRTAEQGTDPDHGLYRFKSGFGGRASELCSGSLVLRPALAAVLTSVGRIRAAARNTALLLNRPGPREQA